MMANEQCKTVSGVYRCTKTGPHDACEAQAREYAATSVFVAQHGYWFDLCAACKVVTKHRASGCEQCTAKKASA